MNNTYFTKKLTVVAILSASLIASGHWEVYTIAGDGIHGIKDSTDSDPSARFCCPAGISNIGNALYVADSCNYRVSKLEFKEGAWQASTIAGSIYRFFIDTLNRGLLIDALNRGLKDGKGKDAKFYNPEGITSIDNILYVTDPYNKRICKLMPNNDYKTWHVTTITCNDKSQLNTPHGIIGDNLGNLYVTDNNCILKLELKNDAWKVTTIAGGTGGFKDSTDSDPSAQFYMPHGITHDKLGNIYVADTYNHGIRKLASQDGGKTWKVTTIAGGTEGFKDSTDSDPSAQFSLPMDITNLGNALYVADRCNNRVRKLVSQDGGQTWQVTTIAGSIKGFKDSTVSDPSAHFYGLNGITSDNLGNLYVTDDINHRICKLVFVSDSSNAPIAKNGMIEGNENTTITGTLASGPGSNLIYSLAKPSKNGRVKITDNGTYTYSPYDPNFSGTDLFIYQVKDDKGGSTTAEIKVNINPIKGYNAIFKTITQPIWGLVHYWQAIHEAYRTKL